MFCDTELYCLEGPFGAPYAHKRLPGSTMYMFGSTLDGYQWVSFASIAVFIITIVLCIIVFITVIVTIVVVIIIIAAINVSVFASSSVSAKLRCQLVLCFFAQRSQDMTRNVF